MNLVCMKVFLQVLVRDVAGPELGSNNDAQCHHRDL